MKKLLFTVIVMALAALVFQANGRINFKAQVSGDEEGVAGYYVAVGNYNNIRENEIVLVSRRGLADEDLPVVFFIASKAGVPYEEIVLLRLQRWSWMKIAMKYRLDPGVFYMPVNGEIRSNMYGRPYRYFTGRPQHNWRHIRLSDADIVNFVNLRFVSEHYSYDPHEVMKMRDEGRSFVSIDNDVRAVKVKVYNDKKGKKGRGNKNR